ncbi:unnamed protein product [Dicrocoelium dendriticum]|nr:unnamed protein product [Dicrocoelium dendriticum]
MRTEIKSLLYWRNPLRSAAVLAALLLVEICFACLSAISILAYAGFILIVAVNLMRLYYYYVAKTDSPLIKEYLERDISLPKDRISDVAHRLADQAEKLFIQAREIFLLTNFGASVKFGLLLYLMTYVGAHFNFLTLCIIGTLLAFSVPKFYESYQSEIDRFLKTVKDKSERTLSRINAQLDKLPVLGSRKAKSQ